MILIQNISKQYKKTGKQKYQLRINTKVICEFEHDRKLTNLSDCLRAAADAVDKQRREDTLNLLTKVSQELGMYDE